MKMAQDKKRLGFTLFLLVFGFVLLVLVTAWMTDGERLTREFSNLRPWACVVALLFSAVSYLSITLSFWALLRVAHHQVGFGRLTAITLISTTFNYVVSTAGLSSLAVRLYLFKREKVPMTVTAPVSVAQSMLTNVVLSMVCLAGLLYLRTMEGFAEGPLHWLVYGAMGTLLVLVGTMGVVFFQPRVRRWTFARLIALWHWLQRKGFGHDAKDQRPEAVLENVERSIRLLHQDGRPLSQGLFYVALDWGFTALTLYACFLAVDLRLSAGYLLVGFTLAFLSTTLNLLPGGLGVMEGLLTLVYAHFGIPPEKAMVAALLFRVVYFLVPLALSSLLYLETLKRLLKGDYQQG
jgi:hypothetical protein